MAETPPSRLFRAALFVAAVWTVATWIFLVDNNLFSQRERFQESDFIMTFYVAGQLVLAGRSVELYPEPDAKSFVSSPFDKAAHEFLPHLPKGSTGAYMYTPLVAGFFAPLSLAGPNYALLIWQALSVLALAFSCWLLARVTSGKAGEIFFLASLYFPVFLTLWAGQLGLAFGVAPLCAGYFLLLRQWPLAASSGSWTTVHSIVRPHGERSNPSIPKCFPMVPRGSSAWPRAPARTWWCSTG